VKNGKIIKKKVAVESDDWESGSSDGDSDGESEPKTQKPI